MTFAARQLTSVALIVSGMSAALYAQIDTATLRGTVHDSAGQPVPHIAVSVTDAATNLSRSLTTDGSGSWAAPLLPAGTYRIKIEERGYQKYSADNILVEPNQVRRIDAVIQTGTPEESAPVAIGPAAIGTQEGAVRTILDFGTLWPDTPLVEKRPSIMPLVYTAPGVQGADRNRQTWTVDGITTDWAGGEPSHPLYFETVDVTTANGAADLYRPYGLGMVSKRGGNSMHGSLYYKFGSSVLDARPYFDARKNTYHLGEAGVEAGGALIKDWTFFYGGWVRQTDPYRQTLYADVPTAQMRLHDFSQYLDPKTSPTGQVVVIRDPRNGAPFPNNTIPSTRVAAVSASIMNNYYPSPNAGGANTFLQNYTWDHPFGPDIYRGNWPFLRVDQKVSDTNHVEFRFFETATSGVATGSVGEALSSTRQNRYKTLSVSDTAQFGSSVVNRFTASFSRNRTLQGEEEGNFQPLKGDSVITTTGLQGVNINGYSTVGFPSIAINGITGLSTAYSGGYTDNLAQNDRRTTVQDAISWSHGRHTVRAGVDYSRYHWLQGTLPQENYGAFTFSGSLTGLGFADFLLGYPTTSSRMLQAKADDRIRQYQAGAWITDNLRVNSRLNIEYGVRWDYFGSPVYESGYMYNWDPATGRIIVAPGTLTAVSALYPKSIQVTAGDVVPKAKTTNVRPRVSFAYRLSERSVLRGGYGEFTDGGPFGTGSRINDPNGPFRLVETYTNSVSNGTVAYAFPKPFPSTASSTAVGVQSVTALPTAADEGVIRQYNATLERAVRDWTVRASFIGARGAGMNYSLDTNKPRASTTPFALSRRPYPQFGSTFVTRTDGEWRYDSLQVDAQKRTGRVTLDSNFTWADNRANYLNTYDPYDVTNQWTRDGGTRKLYATASAAWSLPTGTGRWRGDWTLHAIGTLGSGQYYSPLFTGADPANAAPGVVTALPDCTGDPNAGAHTISQWFNPAAFSIPGPSAGRYGTCGMNTLEGFPLHAAHVSINKRIRLTESLSAVFTVQASNVTNSPHFTTPSNNISNPGAGAFTAASIVPDFSPAKQAARQIDVKLRLAW